MQFVGLKAACFAAFGVLCLALQWAAWNEMKAAILLVGTEYSAFLWKGWEKNLSAKRSWFYFSPDRAKAEIFTAQNMS